jgi:hypothetical protein
MDPGGNTVPGVLNGNCGPGDAGVCFPQVLPPGISIYGVCIVTGDAGAGSPCDPYRERADPSLLCSGGLFCAAYAALDGGSVCIALCDPSSDAGCSGANETCTDISQGLATNLGFCCLSTGQNCTGTQACCFGCNDGGVCN